MFSSSERKVKFNWRWNFEFFYILLYWCHHLIIYIMKIEWQALWKITNAVFDLLWVLQGDQLKAFIMIWIWEILPHFVQWRDLSYNHWETQIVLSKGETLKLVHVCWWNIKIFLLQNIKYTGVMITMWSSHKLTFQNL